MSNNNFEFQVLYHLHKSIIPIGISETNCEQLASVYGVTPTQIADLFSSAREKNAEQATALMNDIDFSSLAQAAPITINFLGDSNTSYRCSYMNIIRTALKVYPHICLNDYAVSGSTTMELARSLHRIIMETPCQIFHILIGTNDRCHTRDRHAKWTVSPDEFRRNMDYIGAVLHESGARIIISSLTPASQALIEKQNSPFGGDIVKDDACTYQKILKKTAEKYNAVFNDMTGIYGQYTEEQLLAKDGIHLSALGHQLLAKQIGSILLKMVCAN